MREQPKFQRKSAKISGYEVNNDFDFDWLNEYWGKVGHQLGAL